MSPARAAAIQAWLRAAYDQLGMRDYVVEFKPDREPRPGADASTWIGDHAEITQVYVHAGFWDEPPDERRLLLLHEALHPLFMRIEQVVRHGLEGALSSAAREMLDHLVEHEGERTVDKAARGLAPLFPPIDDPGGTDQTSGRAEAPGSDGTIVATEGAERRSDLEPAAEQDRQPVVSLEPERGATRDDSGLVRGSAPTAEGPARSLEAQA